MKILLLEDNKERTIQFRYRFTSLQEKAVVDYVDNAVDCIEKLKTNEYDLIFLDHDLGDKVFVDSKEENTGAEVARYIGTNSLKKDSAIIIHTLNPDGAKYMLNTIGGKNCHCVPFAWTRQVFDTRIKINFKK